MDKLLPAEKEPTLNFDSISENFAMYIAGGTLKAIRRFCAQPGGREQLDKWTQEEKEAAKAAKKRKAK